MMAEAKDAAASVEAGVAAAALSRFTARDWAPPMRPQRRSEASLRYILSNEKTVWGVSVSYS